VELAETLPGGFDTIRASGAVSLGSTQRNREHPQLAGGTVVPAALETAIENTSSMALENIYHPAQRWSITPVPAMTTVIWLATASGCQRRGCPLRLLVRLSRDQQGCSQRRARHRAAVQQHRAVHITYADRARFPTLFEMYSTRFSTYINNPDLQPERSHYGQAGVVDTLAARIWWRTSSWCALITR